MLEALSRIDDAEIDLKNQRSAVRTVANRDKGGEHDELCVDRCRGWSQTRQCSLGLCRAQF